MTDVSPTGKPLEVFNVFLKLGLTSFGGPIAHLGYFRAEFVERRRWLSEQNYVDLVALAQFLPGPASSQTAFAIGLMRAGYAGGLAAWLGFTMPSALLMLLFAWGARSLADTAWGVGLLHGLKLVAVAIVAQAVLGMAKALCPDRERATIAVAAIGICAAVTGSLGQMGALLLGTLAGLVVCQGVGRRAAARSAAWAAGHAASRSDLSASFLRLAGARLCSGWANCGALVFGGGHVVLPLLRDAVVAPRAGLRTVRFWPATELPKRRRARCSPLQLSSARRPRSRPGGIAGAAIALVAIFLPGVLILMGILPFWQGLRALPRMQAAMQGINAAVVGLLGAALYNPVWTNAVATATDFAVATGAFVALTAWRAPPLMVVGLCAFAGVALR